MKIKQNLNFTNETNALLEILSVFLNIPVRSVIDDVVKFVGEDFIQDSNNIKYDILNDKDTRYIYWSFEEDTINWVKLAKSKTNALNYSYCYDYLIKNYLITYLNRKNLLNEYKDFSKELINLLFTVSIR